MCEWYILTEKTMKDGLEFHENMKNPFRFDERYGIIEVS